MVATLSQQLYPLPFHLQFGTTKCRNTQPQKLLEERVVSAVPCTLTLLAQTLFQTHRHIPHTFQEFLVELARSLVSPTLSQVLAMPLS